MTFPAVSFANRIASARPRLPRLGRSSKAGASVQVAADVLPEARAYRENRRSSRLCNTFYLSMPADEALVALKNLTLERFSLEFVTIPATGGCVVAVFAPSVPEPVFFSRLRLARQQHDVVRLLTSIGATAV